MVKIFDLIKQGKEKLLNSNTPQLDAEVILSFLLDADRINLYLNREQEVNENTIEQFFGLIERRSNGEPIAYITGIKEFMGMDFIVGPGVLIPRGDTEVLVEAVIKKLEDTVYPLIVDIGCGSGAIAVSLAKYIPKGKIFAVDIMQEPLEITLQNAEKNGVKDKITILKSNILSGMNETFKKSFDAIVSNPPYIEEEVIPGLMKDVKEYEPYTALCGGKDGLDFYRQITREAVNFLKPKGLLAYEIGYDQYEAVANIMEKDGFSRIECIKDLAGLNRVVVGYLG